MNRPTVPGLTAALALAALLTGCASTTQPVLYPTPVKADAGAEPKKQAERHARVDGDMAQCRAAADEAVGLQRRSPQAGATQVARRGAVEFVDKAVESLVANARNGWERARGAGAGAMAGSVTAVLLNWNEPDGVYRSYVEQCLRERGHRVLGWR